MWRGGAVTRHERGCLANDGSPSYYYYILSVCVHSRTYLVGRPSVPFRSPILSWLHKPLLILSRVYVWSSPVPPTHATRHTAPQSPPISHVHKLLKYLLLV